MIRRLITRVLLVPIDVYRWFSAGATPHCRYWPSCSEYAREAVLVHGPARGSWLALRRLGRCRPGGGWGYDPVPQPNTRSLQGSTARSTSTARREALGVE